MLQKDVEIINKLGMHARAAAKFVGLASAFESHIEVEKGGKKINGKSIMGVMMLAASKGSVVTLHISGNDEEAAMSKLESLINDRFGEEV